MGCLPYVDISPVRGVHSKPCKRGEVHNAKNSNLNSLNIINPERKRPGLYWRPASIGNYYSRYTSPAKGRPFQALHEHNISAISAFLRYYLPSKVSSLLALKEISTLSPIKGGQNKKESCLQALYSEFTQAKKEREEGIQLNPLSTKSNM